MKKVVSIVVLLAVIMCAVMGFVACDFFSSDSDRNSSSNSSSNNSSSGSSSTTRPKEQVTINVYSDDVPTSYTLIVGQTAKINPNTKHGYYLLGYYTEQVGGTKYFDVNGESSAIWEKSYPTTFYAQWQSVDNYRIINYQNDETTQFWGGHSDFDFTLKDMARNSIMGNLDRTIRFELSFKTKNSHAYNFALQLRDGYGDSAETFVNTNIAQSLKDWEQHNMTVECSARIFKGDYTMLLRFDGDRYSYCYIKDLVVTATILPLS